MTSSVAWAVMVAAIGVALGVRGLWFAFGVWRAIANDNAAKRGLSRRWHNERERLTATFEAGAFTFHRGRLLGTLLKALGPSALVAVRALLEREVPAVSVWQCLDPLDELWVACPKRHRLVEPLSWVS